MATKILLERRTTVSAKLVRNILYGGLRLMLIGPVPFLLTPFILKKLGPAGFGTWAVFFAAVNLTSLADFGLVGTISKHVAEYYAKSDFAALAKLINTALVLFAAIAALLTLGLWLAAGVLVPVLFRGSPASAGELVRLLHFGALLVALNIMSLLFSSIAAGLQRMDLTNVLASCNVLLAAALSAVFLALSYGLGGLLLANCIAAVVTLSTYTVVVRLLLPDLQFRPEQFDFSECRTMFSFSLQFYTTQMAFIIHNQLEKLYLSRFVGVVAAGWYDIASDSAVKIRSVPGLLLTPLMPAASALAARDDRGRIAELYYRAHKYLAVVGIPLVAYVAVVAPRFVQLWLGPGFDSVATPLRVLVLVNFFNLTTGPGYMIFVGHGILRPGMYSAAVGMGLNVIVSFVLIYLYGFPGAVVGTSISLIAASAVFIYLFHRRTGYPFSSLFRQTYLKPVVCSAILLALLSKLIDWKQLHWRGIVFAAIAFGAAYLLALIPAKFFDRFDVDMLESHLPVCRVFTRLIRIA